MKMKINSLYPFIMGIRPRETFTPAQDDYLGEIARYSSTIYREGSTDGFRRLSDADTDAKKFVQNALSRTLGRRLNTTDPKAILATIDRAFTSKQDEIGNTVFEWTPRSYAVQTELGGKITGAQASLYRRAKSALDEILPLLDRLEPLQPAPDEEKVAAYRSIVRQEIITLVDELGIEGGWRESRVNLLFGNLLGRTNANGLHLGHIWALAEVFGINPDDIVTIQEEETVTDFIVIFDHIQSLRNSWQTILKPHESQFLGTQVVLIERALHSLVEGVDELRYVMESVGLGEAERRVVRLGYVEAYSRHNYQLVSLTIEEMLDWIVNFATEEAPHLIENAGRIGINTLLPSLHRLYQIVSESLDANDTHTALQTSRVISAVDELASHILQVDEIIVTYDGRLENIRDLRRRRKARRRFARAASNPDSTTADFARAIESLFAKAGIEVDDDEDDYINHVHETHSRYRDVEPQNAPAQPAPQPDGEPYNDLTRIIGIGNAIANALNEAGITSFEQLAHTSVAEIQVVLSKHPNRRANTETIESWIEQARKFATDAE